MSGRTAMPPKKQSRRVAAWIYAVINPIINSLARESLLLESGNLTWRSNSGRCEMIRAIQEYIDTGQWPNYFDFCAENKPFKTQFEEHDLNLGSLNSAAKAWYDFQLSSRQFEEIVLNVHLEAYEKARASIGPHAPSFSNSRGDIPRIFAENIINNLETLPAHYLYSPLWNFRNKELLGFRNNPEFAPLQTAIAALRRKSAALKAGLEDHRLSLSRRFDIPAAPVPGLSLEE